MVMGYLRRAYSSFAAHVFDVPPRFMAFLLLMILLLIPAAGLGPYYLSIMIYANVVAILAASWDLLVGRTGQISLGHAIFFGVGGYSSALLFKYYGFSIWVTIPIALLIGSLAALLLGFPSLRVKGPYLALVTMSFPLIIASTVKWSPLIDIFGGEYGIRPLPGFFPFLPILQQRTGEYYFTLLLLFVSAVTIYKIANSKTGIVFMSILDDEGASKACGINVTRYKLMSFMISGLFGTLAGSVQAHLLKVANPPMFELTISFIPIIVTFLGGIGTIYGPIVGAYIYTILDRYFLTDLLPRILRDNFQVTLPTGYEYAKLLAFTLIVLILVIKWPRGVSRFTTDKLKDLEEARDLDERGPRIWKKYKKKKSSTPT
jgi:branched-chain amino acid transport system permease protein